MRPPLSHSPDPFPDEPINPWSGKRQFVLEWIEHLEPKATMGQLRRHHMRHTIAVGTL